MPSDAGWQPQITPNLSFHLTLLTRTWSQATELPGQNIPQITGAAPWNLASTPRHSLTAIHQYPPDWKRVLQSVPANCAQRSIPHAGSMCSLPNSIPSDPSSTLLPWKPLQTWSLGYIKTFLNSHLKTVQQLINISYPIFPPNFPNKYGSLWAQPEVTCKEFPVTIHISVTL